MDNVRRLRKCGRPSYIASVPILEMRKTRSAPRRGIATGTERLTQGFFLLVHEDRRVDREADSYIEIKCDGDLAESIG